MRIRESIIAMILVASRYKNQFHSLNYVVNTVTVSQNFDSRKSKRNSTPASRVEIIQNNWPLRNRSVKLCSRINQIQNIYM